MSRFKFLVFLVGLILADSTLAGDSEIIERIKKVGEVCTEGEDCSQTAAVITVASNSASAGVEDNYNKSCATCHNAGIAGAPKMGDTKAWEARIAKGMDALYNSAISGMPPAMPQKGMCFSCSDDDLKVLVDFMVDSVR